MSQAFCTTQDGAPTGIPNFFDTGSEFIRGPALGAIDRTWTRINTRGSRDRSTTRTRFSASRTSSPSA